MYKSIYLFTYLKVVWWSNQQSIVHAINRLREARHQCTETLVKLVTPICL